MKRHLLFLTVILMCFAMRALAQGGGQNFDNVQIQTVPVQGNIYMLVGAGGNVTVQVGNDGVLIVDTQFAPMAPKILAAIRKLSDKPVRYIINTHVHRDHSGGNEELAKATGAQIIAHENVLKVMSAPPTGIPNDPNDRATPKGLWPTQTYTDRKILNFNGEEIEILYLSAAHSSGDSVVFFHGSNVITAGDAFAIRFPAYDYDGGGRIQGSIDGLNKIIALIRSAKTHPGRTYIIPGHGRVCDEPDVVKYRDMSIVLRDRIRNMIKKGMTLDQVKAAKPLADYDALYYSPQGLGSDNTVTEVMYKDLSQNK
jgi:glyoxylase-like metal-dependent hydrolase (beta-lactamase superfamily II)